MRSGVRQQKNHTLGLAERVRAEDNTDSGLWQTLNSHAVEDSATVKLKRRLAPGVFDLSLGRRRRQSGERAHQRGAGSATKSHASKPCKNARAALSDFARSQSPQASSGRITTERFSSPGLWNRCMRGWPSALIVSRVIDQWGSPASSSLRSPQPGNPDRLAVGASDRPAHRFSRLVAGLEEHLGRDDAELPALPGVAKGGLLAERLRACVVGRADDLQVVRPRRDQPEDGGHPLSGGEVRHDRHDRARVGLAVAEVRWRQRQRGERFTRGGAVVGAHGGRCECPGGHYLRCGGRGCTGARPRCSPSSSRKWSMLRCVAIGIG